MKQKTGTINLSSQKEKLSGHPLVQLLIENLEFVFIAVASQAEQFAETFKAWNTTASAVELRLYAPDDTHFTERQIYQMNVYEQISRPIVGMFALLLVLTVAGLVVFWR